MVQPFLRLFDENKQKERQTSKVYMYVWKNGNG